MPDPISALFHRACFSRNLTTHLSHISDPISPICHRMYFQEIPPPPMSEPNFPRCHRMHFFERNLTRPVFATCQCPSRLYVTGCIFLENLTRPIFPICQTLFSLYLTGCIFERLPPPPLMSGPIFPIFHRMYFLENVRPICPIRHAPFFLQVTGCIFSRISRMHFPHIPDPILPISHQMHFRRLASMRHSLQRAATSWSGRWRPPSHAPRVCSPTRRICPTCRTPMFFISPAFFVCVFLALTRLILPISHTPILPIYIAATFEGSGSGREEAERDRG